MITMAQVLSIARGKQTISIDGLPVSGKSTLAGQLEHELGAVCLYLDDFVMPESLWPRPLAAGYPFPYIRLSEFQAAAIALATTRTCTFRHYDWQSGTLGEPRSLHAQSFPAIIEGVSALDPTIAPHCDLRLWVESDRNSTLQAALARGVGQWAEAWEHYFLPSVDRYLTTDPGTRADHTVAGRGA